MSDKGDKQPFHDAIDDDLNELWDAVEQDTGAEEPTDNEPAEPVETPDPGDDIEAEGADTGDAADGDDLGEPDPDDGATEPTEDDGADLPPIDPPQYATKAVRDLWDKAPREVQEAFVAEWDTRNKDISVRLEEANNLKKQTAPLMAAIEPWRGHLAQYGVDAGTAFDRLMRAQVNIMHGTPTQKANAFKQLMSQANVDPSSLVEKPAADEWVDPQFETVNSRLERIESGIQASQQEAEAQRQAAQAAAAQRQQREIQAELQAFETAVDEAGQPKHPHYQQVRHLMGPMMQSGRAKTLEEAYDFAIWADPTVRATLTAKQEQDLKQRDQQRQKKAAQQAKRDGKANVRSSATPTKAPAAEPETLDETIEAIGAELSIW